MVAALIVVFMAMHAFGFDKHIVSRWGGDEFAIIYYGEKDELIQKLEDIRESFRAYISAYEETKTLFVFNECSVALRQNMA